MTRRLGRWNVGTLALIASISVSCDPQRSSWGFQGIDQMVTPPDDPSLGCGVALPADTSAPQRDTCTFGPGAMPAQTLGIDGSTAASIPIRHIVILMKENRSFDHLLGKLSDRGGPAVDPQPPGYTNPDLQGIQVAPFHATTTCWPNDPGHQSSSVIACIDGDLMDGFVRSAAQSTPTDGHFVMSFYDDTDLPFDYFLAETFAVGDRDFAPMASGTYGNRDFLLFATNAGVVDTGIVYPTPNTPSLMQILMAAGFTWAAYTDSQPFSGALDWQAGDPGVHTLDDLYAAMDQGTLPNVAFVDGLEDVEDDHPTADLQVGEAWLQNIYDHAVASPQWPRMAMIWTYDEAGAFADHLAPEPRACQSAPDAPFTERGPRIPLVAISPWAKRTYASHLARDHTAITRFVETVFQLPALTPRDANSDALLDLFDFSCGRDLSVPPRPDAGTGGCR
jgi:phospholipase C